jgi:hypothetical protein
LGIKAKRVIWIKVVCKFITDKETPTKNGVGFALPCQTSQTFLLKVFLERSVLNVKKNFWLATLHLLCEFGF